jgi:hypothetical protein
VRRPGRSSLADAAILTANDLAPSEVRVGEITVTNIGDTSGAFALESAGLTDSSLSRELDLTLQDVTAGDDPALVYSGKLASLSSVALGSMAQGEAHRYRFSVSLPSDAGDSYQGASSAPRSSGRPPLRNPTRLPLRSLRRIPRRLPLRSPERLPRRLPDRIPRRLPLRLPERLPRPRRRGPPRRRRPSPWPGGSSASERR